MLHKVCFVLVLVLWALCGLLALAPRSSVKVLYMDDRVDLQVLYMEEVLLRFLGPPQLDAMKQKPDAAVEGRYCVVLLREGKLEFTVFRRMRTAFNFFEIRGDSWRTSALHRIAIPIRISLAVLTGVLLLFCWPSARSWWRRRQGVCQTCGYSLAGAVSSVCSECGSSRPAYRGDETHSRSGTGDS